MKKFIISIITLGLSLTAVLAITRQPVILRTSISRATTALDPDESFRMRLAVTNILDPADVPDSDVPALNVFSHYSYPPELELVDVGVDTCAKLPERDQLVCALYTIRDGQTKPSVSANFSGRPSFRLKNPAAFCAGFRGIKTLNLGSLGVNSQGQRDFNITTDASIKFDCNLLNPIASNNVDLNVRFLGQAPSNVNSYDIFKIKVQARNLDSAASPIHATQVTLNYPNAIEYVPGQSPNDNCIISGANQLTCNYASINTAKTKEIGFRIKSSESCNNLVGTYAFRATAVSNATGSQARIELNPNNNTNISSNNLTLSCENVPDVRFLLVEPSNIELIDPEGGESNGDPGKYAGTLRFRMEVNNPSATESLNIGTLALKLGTSSSNQLKNKVTIDNSADNQCSASYDGVGNNPGRESIINCAFNPIAPLTKVSKEFSLRIINPNLFSDRAPFDPLGLCLSKMNIQSNLSPANLVQLDRLKGWTDGTRGDANFESKLDTSILQGLDCVNQSFTAP